MEFHYLTSVKLLLCISFCLLFIHLEAQTEVTIFPQTELGAMNDRFDPGVFFVPKTSNAYDDFVNNGITQNAIRTNVIESALNNSTNLNDCISFLLSVQTELQTVAAKTDELYFIFEKMPPWLSSSSNPGPAATPGWSVLNTKAPSSWLLWEDVVDSITETIYNTMGITNARFEIWNEPDIGSWTDTKANYFQLFRRTFQSVKGVNSTIPVGGPAVNFWSNNIGWQAPYGWTSEAVRDSSLIHELIDSCATWGIHPDFLSFHYFGLTDREFNEAYASITGKVNANLTSPVELVISEWNAPSAVRDTPLATAYTVRAMNTIASLPYRSNMVAAWQDFESSTIEFHQDYGLLTYGAIHKPAYNAILLANEQGSEQVSFTSSAPLELIASTRSDTLYCLIANYCPPALLEALNHTLYDGHLNLEQLDSAGLIDITGGDFSTLENVYNGTTTLSNSSAFNMAVNSGIPVYEHFDSIASTDRHFLLTIDGFTGNYSTDLFLIDDTHNNQQYRYDSLLTEGFTQSTAIPYLIADQSLQKTSTIFTGSGTVFQLQPNAVMLMKIVAPGLSVYETQQSNIRLSPNPCGDVLIVEGETTLSGSTWLLHTTDGKTLQSLIAKQESIQFETGHLPPGMYTLTCPEMGFVKRFVKR